jgi:3-methyladenine DNA glycosylase AlkD
MIARRDSERLVHLLQTRLEARAEPETRAWWERYLKGVIPFRGLKMAAIRSELHGWIEQEAIAHRLEPGEQLRLALDLMRESHTEDKLAGILYLQEVLIPASVIDCRRDLPAFASLFQQGHIADWNTCDWFCVRVLGPLAQQQGPDCARAIAAWRDAHTLWQRRAAAVAFVNLAKDGEANFPGFNDILLGTCAALARDPTRFAQTGAGWVLRELAKADQPAVVAFIESNLETFSREGLRYATEKMPSDIRSRLRQMHLVSGRRSR